MLTVEQILEQVAALPVEQQELLVNMIQSRIMEARRSNFATDTQVALTEFEAGNLPTMTADDTVIKTSIALDEPNEAELIERITATPPFDEERLATLQAKRDAGTLPESELLAWQQLKIAADSWRVQRQTALVQLAGLRGVDLPEIQAEFGFPVTHQAMKGRLAELRSILAEDDFTLVIPERRSRPTPFD